MIPLKKIYIDSRQKADDSVSDRNFKIELPYVLQMPANTVFFITDVCIPHVWKTIEANINDKLYLATVDTINNINYYVIVVAAGNYTLDTFMNAVQSIARKPSRTPCM